MSTPAFLSLPLSEIGESPHNPRSHYDPDELEELAESIREVGILEPLLVRPRIRDGEPREVGRWWPYEIVAGHRRARAARMAGLTEAPCLVRELDDAQALEAALVENGQRQDVTPMDEAGAFAELVRLGRSEAQIAAKIGRSVAYVSQRLRLLSLDPAVHDLMERGHLLIGGALLLAQLEPERQREAVEQLARWSRTATRRDVATVVERTSRRLSLAVWPLDGTEYGPACATCPKRTGTQRALLAECEGADLCLDGACWASKGESWLAAQRIAGRTIVEGEEVHALTRWDAPWVFYDDEAVEMSDEDGRSPGTWGEALSGVLPTSATVIVIHDGETRIAARCADVADAIEDDWPEAAAELRRKAQRQPVRTTPAEPPAAPVEDEEARAAREQRNAAIDRERKIEEETRLLTIERIAEAAGLGLYGTARGIAIACAEALGTWMLAEMADRRGIEDGATGMRDWMTRAGDDDALSVIAEMLAIRYVRNAPPGEVPPQLAPLLTALRVKPADALAEVTERYAPKVEGSKKVAKKVRVKRDAAEAT